MEVIAYSKYIRISPRKLRLVADAVRYLPLTEALLALENIDKKGAKPLLDTFKQAIGNAVNNFHLVSENLKIKEIQIGAGPSQKRWRAVSRGRAHKIIKRTSHIKVVLEEVEGLKKEAISPVGRIAQITKKIKQIKPKKEAEKKAKKRSNHGAKS